MTNAGKTILFVRGDGSPAAEARSALEGGGFALREAAGAEEALALLARGEPVDLVLAEIGDGPGRDGAGTAGAILARRELPVLFLLADGSARLVERAEAVPNFGCVASGSGAPLLLAAARNALRLFAAGRSVASDNGEDYRGLFDRAPIGIAHHRMEYDPAGRPVDYFFLSANKTYKELTGVDPVGKLVTEAFPGIDKDPFDWIGVFGEVVRTGVEKRFKQHLALKNRWYDCVAYRNRPGHFVVAFNEITEHALTEAALEKERSFMGMIMETSPVGIATVDASGAITYANRRAEEILGLSKESITSRDYNAPGWHAMTVDGKPFPDESQPFSIVRRTLAPTYDVRHAIEWPDGRRVVLSVNARPMLETDGSFRGMVATFEDITARHEADERIRAMLREKELILKETHHRIKNNMGIVASLLNLEAGLQAETACGDVLSEAAGRVHALTELYDRLYRSELTGDQDLSDVLPDLLDQIVSLVAGKARIALKAEIARIMLPAKTIVSIGIILNELVTNSAKYAFPGRDRGFVSVGAAAVGDRVLLRYADDGIGLPPDVTFEESSGFGMQLIGVLAEELGAKVTMERGAGAAVSFDFPAKGRGAR
ncbi:MAG: PAS domain S-box protein [Spirochaetaceae bacterium]|nr:PAS domain S-box protein [Spirochaetaceae bacterium]